MLGPEKQSDAHQQPQGRQYAGRVVHRRGGTLNSTVVSGFAVELDRLFRA